LNALLARRPTLFTLFMHIDNLCPLLVVSNSTLPWFAEESKGGIKYDVLIGEPKVVTPRMHAGTVRPLSAEIIQLKITAAAERRKVSVP